MPIDFARRVASPARTFAGRAKRALTPSMPPKRALPIPDGLTEPQIRSLMSTIRVDEGMEDELAGYLNECFGRSLHTWGLARAAAGRALELGANPYFTTWLLQNFTDLDLTLANYFGDDRYELTQTVRYRTADGEEVADQLLSDLFNMEQAKFPYDDSSFDVVLFCEIIEHLLLDPMHPLREIHRVLKPSGQLVLTTPNVARLSNVLALVAGENIYDPYSGHGAYGRHNREFTLHEVVHLLRFCGFTVDVSFTADSLPEDLSHRAAFAQVMRAVDFRRNDLGQYLFVSARKTHDVGDGLPAFLYRSWPPEETLVDVFSYTPG